MFFFHWSKWVPTDVLERFECVCFHMTDVPYGRGGSPLQNLIARGHETTKLTALRMVEAFDAGPVYAKRDLTLGGTAEDIFLRVGDLSAEVAAWIAREQPTPTPQQGEPTVFKRRTPDQSALPPDGSLQQLHDLIRMLDAEGYPHAHLDHGAFRLTFTRSARYDGRVQADVSITLRPDSDS